MGAIWTEKEKPSLTGTEERAQEGAQPLNPAQKTYGSFRKLGVPYFQGPYNKDPTI